MSSARPSRPSTTRRRGLGCALALLSLAALLALAELALRLAGIGAPPGDLLVQPGRDGSVALTEWDRDLLYRLRPGIELFGVYRTNSRGGRGPDLPDPRAPDLLLVAATGDSSTFGMGVADDATWPAQLQRQLEGLLSGDRPVAVLNAGVPGYSSEMTARQVARDLAPLRPQLLVACLTGENDSRWAFTQGDRALLDGNTWLRATLERTRLAGAFRGAPTEAALRMDRAVPRGTPGARARVTPEEFAANLRRIVAAARDAGAEPVLVRPGHSDARLAEEPWLAQSEQAVGEASRETGARLADARAGFGAVAPCPLFSDGIHYVPLGQRLVAASVVGALLDDGVPLARDPDRARWLAAWNEARHRAGLWPGVPAGPAPDRPPCAAEGLFGPGAPPALLAARQAAAAGAARAVAAVRAELARERERAGALLVPEPLLAWAGAGAIEDAGTLLDAEALAGFERSLGLAPPLLPRDYARGLAAIRAGRPELALPLLDAALGVAPGLAAARFERAWLLRLAGRRDEARAAFEAVRDADPDGALGLCVRGMFALEAGDPAGAEASLRGAVHADGGLGHARYLLARALLALDRLDEAREQAETARLLLPGGLDISGLLAQVDARAAELAR